MGEPSSSSLGDFDSVIDKNLEEGSSEQDGTPQYIPRRRVTRRRNLPETDSQDQLREENACPLCEYVGLSTALRAQHIKRVHPGFDPNTNVELVSPGKRNRALKDEHEGPSEEIKIEIVPENSEKRSLTTKELIGGRKRKSEMYKKANPIGGDAAQSDMTVGQYMAIQRKRNKVEVDEEVCQEDSSQDDRIDIEGIDDHGEDAVHDNNYSIDVQNADENKKKNTRVVASRKPRTPGRQKVYDADSIPFRLRVGDAHGKYECYVKDCDFRATYRSLRMEHLRAVHPDFKMPSRFLLQRIAKDGVYIDPEHYVPPFACTVDGCDWRGNFRASRSSHIKRNHPVEYEEQRKKTKMGSFHADGQYLCHLPDCIWRGTSRSTRAAHMKKEHPTWRTDSIRKTPIVDCFSCGASLTNNPALIVHVDAFHGLGNHVNITFESRSDYLIWLASVERLFQINFLRRLSTKQQDEHTRYFLLCACNSSKCQIPAIVRNGAYSTNFLKNRMERVITRKRIDCCVYLDVRENSLQPDGAVNVTGCLEHTGHRFGTPLIRNNLLERHAFQEYMDNRNENKKAMSMHDLIDLLSDIEGFTIDNVIPSYDTVPVEIQDENSVLSLNSCIEKSGLRDFIFAKSIVHLEAGVLKPNTELSIGYMDFEMKKLYEELGADRIVVIDQVQVPLDHSVFLFFAMVLDDALLPKCVSVFLTTEQSNGYEKILKQLAESDERPPRTIVGDPSQNFVNAVDKVWPQFALDILISEWTMLDLWATYIDRHVENDVDKFSLMCALRRLLRINDVHQFQFCIVELMEALCECNFKEFLELFDYQLCDGLFFKRWSPFHRSELTSHSNPTFPVSCRYFRERFLHSFGYNRIDQYFMQMVKRIEEFNFSIGSETYTLRELDQTKSVFYLTNMVDVPGQRRVPVGPAVYRSTIPVYNQFDNQVEVGMVDEIYEEGAEGVVVEEEIISEEIIEKVENTIGIPNEMQHHVEDDNVVMVMDELVDVEGVPNEDVEREEIIHECQPGPSGVDIHQRMPDEEDVDVEVEEEPTTYRLKGNPNIVVRIPPKIPGPIRKYARKHETTKSVIGNRRPNRNRYRLPNGMLISDLDRASIQRIASDIIDADKRKGAKGSRKPHTHSTRSKKNDVQMVQQSVETEHPMHIEHEPAEAQMW